MTEISFRSRWIYRATGIGNGVPRVRGEYRKQPSCRRAQVAPARPCQRRDTLDEKRTAALPAQPAFVPLSSQIRSKLASVKALRPSRAEPARCKRRHPTIRSPAGGQALSFWCASPSPTLTRPPAAVPPDRDLRAPGMVLPWRLRRYPARLATVAGPAPLVEAVRAMSPRF